MCSPIIQITTLFFLALVSTRRSTYIPLTISRWLTSVSGSGVTSPPTYSTGPQCIRKAKKKLSTRHFLMEKSKSLKKVPITDVWLYAKTFQIKVVEISITYKKFAGSTCLSLPWGKLEGSKHYNILKWEHRLTFGLNTAKKLRVNAKKFQIKVVRISIAYKKLSERACISLTPEWSEGARKIAVFKIL